MKCIKRHITSEFPKLGFMRELQVLHELMINWHLNHKNIKLKINHDLFIFLLFFFVYLHVDVKRNIIIIIIIIIIIWIRDHLKSMNNLLYE